MEETKKTDELHTSLTSSSEHLVPHGETLPCHPNCTKTLPLSIMLEITSNISSEESGPREAQNCTLKT